MTLSLRETKAGVVLTIRVAAGARRNQVRGVQDGALKLSVAQAPDKGKANQAVIALLAVELQCPKSALQIVSGSTSQQKRLLILGLTADQVASRLTGS